MSLFNYVDAPNSNLTCCICRTPFTDPVTTRTCAHTFCHECILRALTHSPLCPVDRSPLSAEDLWPASPIIRSLVDELVVECVHRLEGCQHTCQRQNLSGHLRDQCMFAEVVCEEPGCIESLLRRDMERHRKEVHVSQSGTKQEDVNVKDHEAISKLKVDDLQVEKTPIVQSSILCPHASLGCPHTSPSTSLIPLHLQQCPYESLKHFFPNNNTRLALLTEQNVLLRARVGTLESTVGTLRREMNAVKAALGPWMKIEQSQTYTSGSMQIEGRREENIPASELPVGMQPASASTSSGEPRNLSPTRVPLSIVSPNAGIADMGAAPGMHDGQAYAQPRQAYPQSQAQQTVASQVNVDPLAFYFPSEHEERPRGHRASASVPDIGPHINTPFQPHNGAQAPHAYSATSLMHTSALAAAISPVNTSVHFEATLNGLRDSIVGVAQTTDALRGVVASEARRGEIALANETLRIGEEVMSLRAGVHGLRMQVHAMMMDRSTQMGGTREGGAEGAWMASMNISQPLGSVSGLGQLSPSPMPGRMYYPMQGPPSITKL